MSIEYLSSAIFFSASLKRFRIGNPISAEENQFKICIKSACICVYLRPKNFLIHYDEDPALFQEAQVLGHVPHSLSIGIANDQVAPPGAGHFRRLDD